MMYVSGGTCGDVPCCCCRKLSPAWFGVLVWDDTVLVVKGMPPRRTAPTACAGPTGEGVIASVSQGVCASLALRQRARPMCALLHWLHYRTAAYATCAVATRAESCCSGSFARGAAVFLCGMTPFLMRPQYDSHGLVRVACVCVCATAAAHRQEIRSPPFVFSQVGRPRWGTAACITAARPALCTLLSNATRLAFVANGLPLSRWQQCFAVGVGHFGLLIMLWG